MNSRGPKWKDFKSRCDTAASTAPCQAMDHVPRRPWSPDEFEQENLAGIGVSTSFLPIRMTHARLREPSDETGEIDLGEVPQNREQQWSTTQLPPSSYEPSRSGYSGSRSARPDYDLNDNGTNPELASFPPWSRHWFEDPLAPSTSQNASSGRTYVSRESVLPWSPLPGQKAIHEVESNFPDFRPPSIFGTPTVSASTKAERIRMLEHEFAAPQSSYGRVFSDDAIGSVDSRGQLITAGPRKRITMRVGQGLAALIAGIGSIYPAIVRSFYPFLNKHQMLPSLSNCHRHLYHRLLIGSGHMLCILLLFLHS